MVCKIFVCSELPDIPENSQRGKKENRIAIMLSNQKQKNVFLNKNKMICVKCLHVYFILVWEFKPVWEMDFNLMGV